MKATGKLLAALALAALLAGCGGGMSRPDDSELRRRSGIPDIAEIIAPADPSTPSRISADPSVPTQDSHTQTPGK